MLNNYLRPLLRKQQIFERSKIFSIFRYIDPLTIDDIVTKRVEAHRIDCIPREGAEFDKARTRMLTEDVSRFVDAALSFAIHSGGKCKRAKYTAISRARGAPACRCFSSAARVVTGQGGPVGGLGVRRWIPSRFSQLTYRFLAGCSA